VEVALDTLSCLFWDSLLNAVPHALQLSASNVCCVQDSFSLVKVVSALSFNCVFSCSLYWLVQLPPHRDRDAVSISQCAHADRATVWPG
jgi:hypothetical protein